jgi:hypothetical protein
LQPFWCFLWLVYRCRDHRPLQSVHWNLELVKRTHYPFKMLVLGSQMI